MGMGLLAGTKYDRPPHCDRCEKLESECTCPPETPKRKPPEKQTTRIGVEKRKHGRVMTIVRDLDPADNDLPELLTKLKNACGAGGTIADGNIEVQGAHLDRIRAELQKIGYKVKG